MPGPCDTPHRTNHVGIRNGSVRWTVEICFIQVKSNLNQPGYITDTGVMVAGTNVPPGSESRIDPCIAKGAPILGTRFEGSIKGTYNGRVQNHNFAPINIPAGQYSKGGLFGIVDVSTIADTEAPRFEIEWIPDPDIATVESM